MSQSNFTCFYCYPLFGIYQYFLNMAQNFNVMAKAAYNYTFFGYVEAVVEAWNHLWNNHLLSVL